MATLVRPVNAEGLLADIRERVAAELGQAARAVQTAAIDRVVSADAVDTGNLVRGIEAPVRVDEGTAVGYDVFSRAAHSIYVELGRAPGGKQPPPKVIRAWVERRLGLTGAEAASAAFLIGRAIAERGIPGLHYMRNAAQSIDTQQLARDITEAIRR